MSDQQLASIKGLGKSGQSDPPSDVLRTAPRVLIVDDDPGIQLLMRETLAKAGFDVSVAASGPEAIEVCPAFMPDLVLLDINMPTMDGITACAEIRKHNKHNFPIIMVTSVDDAVSIQRAFDAGATDFILKPVNWPLFQRRLNSVLAEWNRSQEFGESSRRVRLLEKVAPEQVMLVSRNGIIIEDLKRRSEAGRTETEPPYRSLEDIFCPDTARRFKQRISGVLKTRRHNNLEFAITEQGISRDYEAQFLVDGRDRVIIVVQDVNADKEIQSEIFNLAFYDSISDLPNRHLFERCAAETLIDAGLHDRAIVFIGLCFDNIRKEDLANRNIMLAVAGRLRDCLANCSCVSQIGKNENAARVSRIDSFRFMLTLGNIETANDVSAVCDQIAQGFAKRIVSDSGSITISPRLGVATYPADGQICRRSCMRLIPPCTKHARPANLFASIRRLRRRRTTTRWTMETSFDMQWMTASSSCISSLGCRCRAAQLPVLKLC